MKAQLETVTAYFREVVEVQEKTAAVCAPQILAAADILAQAFRRGGKVLLCGNGGSAADCQHVAAELTGLLRRDFKRPGIPAIALTTDTSFLTAYANDFGFDGVFERQVATLGRAGDVLFAISTSGHSANVLNAVRSARETSMSTIGLMGEVGPLADAVDCAVLIPARGTQHIQETMLPIEHLICQLVEQDLYGEASK